MSDLIAQLRHQQTTTQRKSQLEERGMDDVQSPIMRGPETGSLLQLQSAANASPQVQQFRSLQAGISQSPHVQQFRLQSSAANTPAIQRRENRTGLPDDLKSGIEGLSGMSMDDVRVHYNSDQPKGLQALAYAQGSDIHLGPGQEQHLPHEAWHVVQQKQGRVQPTVQRKGKTDINDDPGLEKEADVMGAKALQFAGTGGGTLQRMTVKGADKSVAQRYRDVSSDDYDLDGESDDEHFFTTQSKDLTLKRAHLSKKYRIEHDVERTHAKKNLFVANDGTMAINNTADEAKEFYATTEVLEHAEGALKEAKSRIKLVKSEALRISNEGQTLHKVTPASSEEEQEVGVGKFASLISNICIEMATGVMGGVENFNHEAVFQTPGSEEENIVNIQAGPKFGDESIGTLAEGLVDLPQEDTEDDTRQGLRDHMVKSPAPKLPGVKYGTAYGNGEVEEEARIMGINQHAHPQVGEGYATFSLQSDALKKQINYATGGDPEEVVGDIWGYHFAGVVAQSQDGADTVTLENYNRSADIMKQLRTVLERQINGNKTKLQSIWNEVAPDYNNPDDDIRGKLIRAFAEIRNISTENAEKEYYAIKATYDPDQSWFFKMQGSEEGQSFHEQQEASNGFINPLTLRVRTRNPEREEVAMKAKVALLRFPELPEVAQEHPLLKPYLVVRDLHIAHIMKAEDEDEISTCLAVGLEATAKKLIACLAGLEVAIVKANGGTVDGMYLAGVRETDDLAAMTVAAGNLGTACHWAIEECIQELWITEVEKKMDLMGVSDQIVELWRYIPKVRDHGLGEV